MNSFLPIVKVIEELACLEEHYKIKQESQGILGEIHQSLDSGGLRSSQNLLNSLVIPTFCPPHCPQSVMKPKGVAALTTFASYEPEPFSVLDAFYSFKSIFLGSRCPVYESLLKSLFAIETN